MTQATVAKVVVVEPRLVAYNPSMRGIAAFFGLAVAIGLLYLVSGCRSRLLLALAGGFIAVDALLLLRRLVWTRMLIVANDSLVVPSGFLRLHARRLLYTNIREVWVTVIFSTAILRVRTPDGDVEIQDMYLPDMAVFLELKQLLESQLPQ